MPDQTWKNRDDPPSTIYYEPGTGIGKEYSSPLAVRVREQDYARQQAMRKAAYNAKKEADKKAGIPNTVWGGGRKSRNRRSRKNRMNRKRKNTRK